ncbi:MAG: hypothetical protein ACRDS0_02820 [Pseudonocardiaceae bacterium]
MLRFDEDTLKAGARLASEALDILARHNLFSVERMDLARWRAPLGESAEKARDVDAPAMSVALTGLSATELESELLSRARSGPGFPGNVSFHGTGLIYDDSGGPLRVDDPLLLTLSMEYSVAVEVSTQLDIWLPFDLRAKEQRTASEHNRPTLRAALEDLANLEGIEVSNSEVSKYAVVEGLHVRNHTNAFGQPVDVL